MNLLEKLQAEVESLHLTDKLSIAKFLYVRTGELFNYNETFYTYRTGGKKQVDFFYEVIDICHVKKFQFVCASWARMFVALLKSFAISAKYIEESGYWHAYVKVYINKKVYIADITTGFEDIVNIKFGLQTRNFYHDTFFNRLIRKLNLYECDKGQKEMLEIDKSIHYYKGIYTDEVLAMIKKEIYAVCYENDLKLIEKVFAVLMLIMNIERPNIGFFSGVEFINKMLEYFLDDLETYIKYSDVYDRKRNKFFEVIVIDYYDLQVFLYEKNKNSYFKLKKVSRKKLMDITENYKWEHKKVLKLLR